MRRLLAAMAVILALPAGAAAKELRSLDVCGQGGECRAVHGHGSLARYERGLSDAAPPEHGGAFLRVRVTIDGEDVPRPVVDTLKWLPAAGLLRSEGDDGTIYWLSVGDRVAAILRRAARGLEPFPASRLGPIGHERPARVDEVVEPRAPATKRESAGGSSWPLSLLALVPLAAFLVMRGRRRWN